MAKDKEQPQDDQVSRRQVLDTVEAWYREHIHNSPASRDTEVYNHLAQARTRLIEQLGSI